MPQGGAHPGVSTIAVVGAGISGLTAAYRLSATHDVVVFERETSAGGKIRSQNLDGYLFEWGPSGILSSDEELAELAGELGLSDALAAAPPAAKNRFIYWGGALHRLPAKPPQALTFSLLTPLARLRALGELLVPKASNEGDESVFAFMQRRFGRQVAERIVSPAVLGVSGGDAATTSVDATFPRLRAMETEHGSILRGMMKGSRKPASTGTFAGGLQLAQKGAQILGDVGHQAPGGRTVVEGRVLPEIGRHLQDMGLAAAVKSTDPCPFLAGPPEVLQK